MRTATMLREQTWLVDEILDKYEKALLDRHVSNEELETLFGMDMRSIRAKGKGDGLSLTDEANPNAPVELIERNLDTLERILRPVHRTPRLEVAPELNDAVPANGAGSIFAEEHNAQLLRIRMLSEMARQSRVDTGDAIKNSKSGLAGFPKVMHEEKATFLPNADGRTWKFQYDSFPTQVTGFDQDGSTINVHGYATGMDSEKGAVYRIVPFNYHSRSAHTFESALAMPDVLGWQEGEPYYALFSNFHFLNLNLGELGGGYATQLGFTHSGAAMSENGQDPEWDPERIYLRTTNQGLSDNELDVGYSSDPAPVVVHHLELQGEDRREVDRTLLTVDAVFEATGVDFPGNYSNDNVKVTDLNTALMFFRDIIFGQSDYLLHDADLAVYCSEFKSLVMFVGLNLPMNEASFKEVYGAEEGARLWRAFTEEDGYFEKALGRPFDSEKDQTFFEPLWKKEGLQPSEIQPAKSIEEWRAHVAWLSDPSENRRPDYAPLKFGEALPIRPISNFEMIRLFVEMYTPTSKVSSVVQSGVIIGFASKISERQGITIDEYMKLALPLISQMASADIARQAVAAGVDKESWSAFLTQGTATWLEQFKLFLAQMMGEQEGAEQRVAGIIEGLRSLLAQAAESLRFTKQMKDIDRWYEEASYALYQQARTLPGGFHSVTNNFAPLMFQMGALNAVPTASHVKVRPLFILADPEHGILEEVTA